MIIEWESEFNKWPETLEPACCQYNGHMLCWLFRIVQQLLLFAAGLHVSYLCRLVVANVLFTSFCNRHASSGTMWLMCCLQAFVMVMPQVEQRRSQADNGECILLLQEDGQAVSISALRLTSQAENSSR